MDVDNSWTCAQIFIVVFIFFILYIIFCVYQVVCSVCMCRVMLAVGRASHEAQYAVRLLREYCMLLNCRSVLTEAKEFKLFLEI
jgi:hypothetical protein